MHETEAGCRTAHSAAGTLAGDGRPEIVIEKNLGQEALPREVDKVSQRMIFGTAQAQAGLLNPISEVAHMALDLAESAAACWVAEVVVVVKSCH